MKTQLVLAAFNEIKQALPKSKVAKLLDQIEHVERVISGELNLTPDHWKDPQKREKTIGNMKKAGKARRTQLLAVHEETGSEQQGDYETLAKLCGISTQTLRIYVSKNGGKVVLWTKDADLVTISKLSY